MRTEGWSSKYDEVDIYLLSLFLSPQIASKVFAQLSGGIQDRSKVMRCDNTGNFHLKIIKKD